MHPPFHPLPSALSVVCLLGALSTSAQPASPGAPPSLPGSLATDVVVTAEATPAEVSALGVAATVVDREEIDRRQQSTLLELLRTVPTIADPPQPVPLPTPVRGDVRLEHV
ncbi:hypothetical protein FBQ97_20050, partial [Acidobacteria bacterium ACD]|nr:hypothetical protein [Acidobacteria bacterium ACD]